MQWGGYEYKKDVLWFMPKPQLISINDVSDEYIYNDEYGNLINTKSPVNIEFCGRNSSIKIGKNVNLPKKTIKIGNNVSLIIGDNCKLSFSNLIFFDGATLVVGDGARIAGMFVFININSTLLIGSGTTMQTGKIRTGRNQKIEIGSDCMFSWDIIVLSHDGHLIWDVENEKCINNTIGEQRESIKIGDHVWVGGETVVMPNTCIGSGSICGYRSLVKGKFPNNCILVGSPAKVIRKNIAWSRPNISFEDSDFLKIDEHFRKVTCEDEIISSCTE